MFNRIPYLSILAIVLLCVSARAQSVQQSGVVTPGHSAQWLTNGVIGDGGAPSGGVGLLGSFVINDMLCSNATGTTISIIDCGFSATGTNNWVGLQNLNGGATAPTRSPGDSTTNVATTAFVQAYNVSLLSTPNTWTALQTFSAGIATNNLNSDALSINSAATGGPTVTFNNTAGGANHGGGLIFNSLNSTPASVDSAFLNCGLSVVTAGSELGLCDFALRAPSGINQIITSALNSATDGCVLCAGNTDILWNLGSATSRYKNIYTLNGTFTGTLSSTGGFSGTQTNPSPPITMGTFTQNGNTCVSHLALNGTTYGFGVSNAGNVDICSAVGINFYPNGNGLSTATVGITAAGNITQAGSSGGVITFVPQASAGTYNWNWPTTAGAAGQPLLSGGGSTSPMTWSPSTLPTNLLLSATAPGLGSCGGGSPAISANNGTAAFRVTVGSATSTCAITLPTATTGWNCYATDLTTTSTTVFITKQTLSGVSGVTLGNFNDTASAANWATSDVLAVSCFAL